MDSNSFNDNMTPKGPTKEATYERLVKLLSRLDDRMALTQKWQVTKMFAASYPVVAVMVVIGVAMCSVPVMCFVAFALGSLFFTVTAFMIMEGAILTVGAICLGLALLVMGFLSLGICGFIAASWLALITVQRIFSEVATRIPDGYKNKFQYGKKSDQNLETKSLKPGLKDEETNT